MPSGKPINYSKIKIHMSLLEIHLKNPVGNDEITCLRSELIAAKKHDYLIIDVGGYDFASIGVLKQFRDLLSDLEPCLMKFKKIVLIHSPMIIKESSSPERYNLCISKEKAIEWLESGGEQ
jgi:hypothetical protein